MAFDLPRDQATAWFDTLYRQADRDSRAIPWADLEPTPWLDGFPQVTRGRAAVVGCGLGDDAEAMSRAGYDTVAFDVSPAAVAWCRERFPDSDVTYEVGDLLDLPADWVGAFDAVVEARTIQSLPLSLREEATDAVASLVAPGGRALVVAWSRPDHESPTGPPWPLSEAEMGRFLQSGLVLDRDRSEDGHFVWELSRHP